jgi:catechol 2,3-dioxygenase-like lactoylglutathione lyase family enzyme
MSLWRKCMDSSHLAQPRVLVRVYVAPGEIDSAIEFYEKVLGVACDMYMNFPPDPPDSSAGLTVAAVGGFLILEGSPEQLAPHRAMIGTLLVDDIGPFFERLMAQGAEILHFPGERLGGAGFAVRHPDGSVMEYVHHRPSEGEG